MSIITDPKESLNPQIWTESETLRPEIKTAILNRVSPFEKKFGLTIKRILIKGSHTGYKWSEDSDLDVNLVVDKDKLPEDWKKTRLTSLHINNHTPQNTDLVINYFLSDWDFSKDLDESYQEFAEYGVWDVKNDYWVIPPNQKEKLPLTESQNRDLDWAKLQEREFKNLWENYKNSPTNKSIYWNALLNLANEIENNRKLPFLTGWGDSRYNENNMVFKWIEDGSQYGKLFKKLMEKNFLKNKEKLQKTATLRALKSGIDTRLFQLAHSKSPALAEKTQRQLDLLKEYYYNKSMRSTLPTEAFSHTRQKGTEAMIGLKRLKQVMNGSVSYPLKPTQIEIQF